MDLFEGGDEGFVVVVAIAVGEGLACAGFFEQVVHAGDGDFGMSGLDLFAVGVEAHGFNLDLDSRQHLKIDCLDRRLLALSLCDSAQNQV